ncbi:glycosyltransferase family 4 protein [Emticicia sp. C21]|uniref:glycosyltransferase family 4 protein n=1 Tax=Emticicia sp. C21 TaxID=2302915 RepID=UPI000E3465A5|nr:glycosyltransferase family 4 protein [Emticicia sp. C21]RFS17236.1 glycosyltransferase [Emticicia sp. C21]
MKLVYLLSNGIEEKNGIYKKIISQIDAWKDKGVDVIVYCITSSKDSKNDFGVSRIYHYDSKNIIGRLFQYIQIYKKIYTDLLLDNPDLIYWRFEPVKPGLIRIIRKFKTVVEINTDILSEYKYSSLKSVKNFIRYLLFKRFNIAFKEIKGFVAVTHEIARRLKEFYPFISSIAVVPNSIDLRKFTTLENENQDKTPVLTFLGSPGYDWHGVDELVKFGKDLNGQIKINIIGYEAMPEIEHYENIIFHGFLDKNNYINILKKTDIAIGVLSLYRKEMDEACPLKVREYLAYGIPMIQSHKETIFLHKENKGPDWCLLLPNEENSLINNKELVMDFILKNKGKRYRDESVLRKIDSNCVEDERLAFFFKVLENN